MKINKISPKVSILIVTYNSGNYIKNTINSCLEQDYNNFDILVLDNNSSDGTKKYLENINDKKIKVYFSEENLGPYNGLNYLLEKTKSDYIAIQDHDDIFHYNKLKESVNFLEKNKEYIACGNNTLVFFEEDKNGYIFEPQQKNHVMHTSLFFKNKGFRYRNNKNYFLEDLYFQRKILLKEGKIGNIDKVLNLHLIKKSNNNLSSNWGELNFLNIKKFFDIYGIGLYGIQIFIIFILKKILPNVFAIYEKRLLKIKYGILGNKEILEDKELSYLKNQLN